MRQLGKNLGLYRVIWIQMVVFIAKQGSLWITSLPDQNGSVGAGVVIRTPWGSLGIFGGSLGAYWSSVRLTGTKLGSFVLSGDEWISFGVQ